MLKGQKSFYDLNEKEAVALVAAMTQVVESNRRIIDRRDKLIDVLNDKDIKCHFGEKLCGNGGRGRILQRKGVKFFQYACGHGRWNYADCIVFEK